MHYYSFNIGDYASHTRHLTPMEDLVYRRLLDLYYLHERPLIECSTTVARLINLRGHEEEVEAVLTEFFEFVDGTGYVNRRADDEIAKYHGKLEAASRAGKASAERRLRERSTDVQPNKKQEPINTKQETEKTKALECPVGVQPATWSDFLRHRKAMKAPVTESALKGIEREARKAGWSLEKALIECCARGWRGFNADWVQNGPKKTQHQLNNEAMARSIGLIPAQDDYQGNVIEGEIYDATPTAPRLG